MVVINVDRCTLGRCQLPSCRVAEIGAGGVWRGARRAVVWRVQVRVLGSGSVRLQTDLDTGEEEPELAGEALYGNVENVEWFFLLYKQQLPSPLQLHFTRLSLVKLHPSE